MFDAKIAQTLRSWNADPGRNQDGCENCILRFFVNSCMIFGIRIWKWLGLFLALLLVWIFVDLFYPFKTNLANVDAERSAELEGKMWRSYYERKPVKLFFQSAELMRHEFHFSFWQSFRTYYPPLKSSP